MHTGHAATVDGRGSLPAPASTANEACRICPLSEAGQRLCHWPHRCVFSGDGIQAWLVGLTSIHLPMVLLLDACLTLIVTFGEVDVTCGGNAHHLSHGQSLALPRATAVEVRAPAQADLLLMMIAA